MHWIESRPRTVLGVSAFVFFGIALTSKYLQLMRNELHGQDFWLFVDALDTASKGGAWPTRFPPQSVDWVQHGAVHAFLPLSLFVPLVWAVGAKWTALLLNPLALSLAGYLLALLARPRWGALGSLAWMLGFYAIPFFWDQGRAFILTDRWQKAPSTRTDQVRFVILERGVDRYLMTAQDVEAVEAELKKNPAWVEVGRNCTRGMMRRVTFWVFTQAIQDAT